MKKTIGAATLALMAVTGVFAQDAPAGKQPGERKERTRQRVTPEQMIERRVQRLTTLLTLDASQQEQAKTIFNNAQSQSEALRNQSRTAQESLQAAVKGSASDAQIDQLAANVGTLHGQSIAVHAKAQAKLLSILNSDQKAKLEASRGRMGSMRGPMGGGGPMGAPGHMRGRVPQR